MKRLLCEQPVGHRIERWWMHVGDDGRDKITVETIEDVEHVYRAVAKQRERPGKDFRFKASIPHTVVEEICRIKAQEWNMKPHQVLGELVRNKTDRANAVWRLLTEGREYRKFQATG